MKAGRKILSGIFLLLLLVTTAPGQPCVPPPAGLVSWWKGEGNQLDSVSSNNGIGNPDEGYEPGEVGRGFYFAGSPYGGLDDGGLLVGNNTNMQLQDLTIECWVKRYTTAFVSRMGPGGVGIIFGWGTGGYTFSMDDYGQIGFGQTDTPNIIYGPEITDLLLHHVAVTKSGSNVVLYLDGVAYSLPPLNVTFNFTQSAGVCIGEHTDTGSNTFWGTIDEMSLYNRALAATEIQAIYNAGTAGKCGPPPSITGQPVNVTALPGCTVNFTVTAYSTSPLTYQWLKNGGTLSGQTNSIMFLTNIQSGDFANYSAIVTSLNGADVISSNVSLVLDQPPVAGPDIIQRYASGGVKVPVSNLLTNDSDTDDDPLSIITVSPTSAANGTVTLQSNWVYYTPPVGFTNTDSYTYIVSDRRCNGTNTGVVTVRVQPDSTPTGTFTFQSSSPGSNVLSFQGFPNRSYRVEYTGSLAAANWQVLSTNVADNFGSFAVIDSTATNAPARYYRAVSP